MKVCSNGPGHMAKMAATPKNDTNPLKIFSRTRRLMTLGLGMSNVKNENMNIKIKT